MTINAWTSPNVKGILGVIGHWIDKNSQLKELIMDTGELRGSYTGVNLDGTVLTTLTDIKLEDKLFCVIGDNASKIVLWPEN